MHSCLKWFHWIAFHTLAVYDFCVISTRVQVRAHTHHLQLSLYCSRAGDSRIYFRFLSTLWLPKCHKISAVFNSVQSVFWLKLPSCALVFLKKTIFFTKQADFHKIRYKNAYHFNLAHAHKPKFGLFGFFFCDCLFRIFFLPLSFPFSRPCYCRYLLRFIFFLAAVKSWVLITDKPWKWDLDQL